MRFPGGSAGTVRRYTLEGPGIWRQETLQPPRGRSHLSLETANQSVGAGACIMTGPLPAWKMGSSCSPGWCWMPRAFSDMLLSGLWEVLECSSRTLGVHRTWIQNHPSCSVLCSSTHGFTSLCTVFPPSLTTFITIFPLQGRV